MVASLFLITNHLKIHSTAIVSRELGVPAIVGCGVATEKLVDGQK